MSTSEQIVLDPADLISGRTEVDITPWIDQDGADWGEASISAFMADKDRGSVPVDFRLENREVSIPLKLTQTIGGTTTVQARAAIQAKAALFQKEGGWLKRITNSGGTVFADIVDCSFAAASVAGFESKQDIDLDAHLVLQCLPDFYEAEVALGDHVETSNPELVFTESVEGDYPARVRVMVDDDQGQSQRGLLWGFRSRYYDSSATAALQYNAESLEALDAAAGTALSGASGGTVVRHGDLSTNWTPVLGTNKGGTAYLTHKGTYRLYARVYSTSGTAVQARAVWDVGDLVNPVENDAWRVPGDSNFYLHDFGELRLDAAPVGTHRWQGQIQAKGDAGGENFSVDRIELVPVDEGMGVLTARYDAAMGLSSDLARDEFNQTAGTLTNKVLPVGGTWIRQLGTAVDFSVDDDPHLITRTGTKYSRFVAPNGVDSGTSRFSAQVDFMFSAVSDTVTLASPDASLGLAWATSAGQISEYAVVILGENPWLRVTVATTHYVTAEAPLSVNTWYTLRVDREKRTSGAYPVARVFARGGDAGSPIVTCTASFASAADNVTPGLVDQNLTATAITRSFDNYRFWTGSSDAVTFGSQSTQLTTDGHYRLDTGGTAYGPVSIQSGDLPRLPVAGLEGRTTEVFIRTSRGDFDQLPDAGIDDTSAQITYSPSWLQVPDQ